MKMNQYSDYELVQAYISGNEAAVETIINRYKRKVYTYIYYRIRNKEIVADLFQDTFIKVFKSIKENKYAEDGKFGAWLMRIAHNLVIDYIRKDNRLKTVAVDSYDYDVLNNKKLSEGTTEQAMIKNEIDHDIRKLLDYLPENQREVIIMRHFLGMSFKEIAEETNVSINTALGRMRYALINLKRIVEEHKLELEINH
ncbi:MAG TPA: RNA polymerase sigma factor [Bacteroidales bacterium]|jgi:RNA polymerase sigma-70 factor (ECF subfamily)|nr:RNA polymerase sigma factor [Bacteroidales bacterium]HOU98715.1 RNA polymerase sigma factor [Bacteroidales bacterium]